MTMLRNSLLVQSQPFRSSIFSFQLFLSQMNMLLQSVSPPITLFLLSTLKPICCKSWQERLIFCMLYRRPLSLNFLPLFLILAFLSYLILLRELELAGLRSRFWQLCLLNKRLDWALESAAGTSLTVGIYCSSLFDDMEQKNSLLSSTISLFYWNIIFIIISILNWIINWKYLLCLIKLIIADTYKVILFVV